MPVPCEVSRTGRLKYTSILSGRRAERPELMAQFCQLLPAEECDFLRRYDRRAARQFPPGVPVKPDGAAQDPRPAGEPPAALEQLEQRMIAERRILHSVTE